MNRELTPWERLDGIKHSLNFTNVALDSIIEDAVEWERLRIIKLLQSQIHGCSGYDCDSCDDSSQIVELIELIKGEK